VHRKIVSALRFVTGKFSAVNYEGALNFSKLALVFESKLEDKSDYSAINNSAGTILNICAILSKLER
jgi:hypothetical protein